MAKFNIGDKVTVYGVGNATVTDRMYSEKKDTHYYSIKFEGSEIEDNNLFDEDELQEYVEEVHAEYEVVTDVNKTDGMVIVSFYETKGDKRKLVCRGHGHMLRRDALGVVQATSFAARRALMSINNDSVNVEKE